MQKECEVGDLVYDPVMGDMGIITGLNGSSFINYQLGVITRVPDRLTLHRSVYATADVLFVRAGLGRFYFYELELISESR